jgi:hypothetical protein
MKLSAALGSLQSSKLGFKLVKLVRGEYEYYDGETVQIPEDWMVDYALPKDKSDLPREISEYDKRFNELYRLNECKDCLTDNILGHEK